jgi:hypothetical protein
VHRLLHGILVRHRSTVRIHTKPPTPPNRSDVPTMAVTRRYRSGRRLIKRPLCRCESDTQGVVGVVGVEGVEDDRSGTGEEEDAVKALLGFWQCNHDIIFNYKP